MMSLFSFLAAEVCALTSASWMMATFTHVRERYEQLCVDCLYLLKYAILHKMKGLCDIGSQI